MQAFRRDGRPRPSQPSTPQEIARFTRWTAEGGRPYIKHGRVSYFKLN